MCVELMTTENVPTSRHVRSAAQFTATTGCRVRSYAATLHTTRRARPAPHDTQTSTWRPSMRKSPRCARTPRRPPPSTLAARPPSGRALRPIRQP